MKFYYDKPNKKYTIIEGGSSRRFNRMPVARQEQKVSLKEKGTYNIHCFKNSN
jgi:hypothetical protein